MLRRNPVRLLPAIRAKSGACVLAIALYIGGMTEPVTAAEYRLGPQDKVKIRIFEWRASRDEIFEWKALNDTFIVNADGTLALPFAGEIEAAGRTPSEVAQEISAGLMQNMGLGRRPDATVEVVEFRPFFIVGEVTQPGAFPFRPDLTVLQAVSLAGGIKSETDRSLRVQREVIQSRGELSVMGLQRLALMARKARLEAELADAETVAFPPEISDHAGDPVAANAMEQERLIFEARRKAVQTQIQALDDLAGFLESELVSLEKQLGLLDRQIELLQKELGNVSSLVQRGIAPAPREMALERTIAQIQSERLTAETALLRARQEISRTELTKLELRNSRANEVATNLRETEAELDALARRAETALHLLHESETFAPPAADALRYTIVRSDETGTRIIEASESTPVLPGDTVKVERLLPLRGAQAPRSAS